MNWTLKWYHFDDLGCLLFGRMPHLVKRLFDLAGTDSQKLGHLLENTRLNGQEPPLIAEVRSVIDSVAQTDVKRRFYPWRENEWPIDLHLRNVQDPELQQDIILTPDSVIMHWPLTSTNPQLEYEMAALASVGNYRAEAFEFDATKHVRILSLLGVLDRVVKEDDGPAREMRHVLSTAIDKEERRMALIAYSEHLMEMGASPFDDGSVTTFSIPESIDVFGFENMPSNETRISRLSDNSFRVDLGLSYVSLSDAGPELEPVGCGAFGGSKKKPKDKKKESRLQAVS